MSAGPIMNFLSSVSRILQLPPVKRKSNNQYDYNF
jgi:hypothetical protein